MVKENVYYILKEIENNEYEYMDKNTFDLSYNEFERAMNFISHEKLLVSHENFYAENKLWKVFCGGLSEKGYKFLEDNSIIGKVYNNAKKIKDLIK